MTLNFFYQELIEKLSKDELSEIDYPWLNKPSPTSPPIHRQTTSVNLAKSKRTPTWARCQSFHDKYSRFSFFLFIFYFFLFLL